MKYISQGHRPTAASDASSPSEIGELFAQRKARRLFGRAGRVGALRLDSWLSDGTLMEFDAFIGRPAPGGGLCGRNVRFTVRGIQ